MLSVRNLRVLYSLSYKLAKGKVVLGEQEGCELEAADLSHLHAVEPAECIGQQFAMGGTHHSLKVFLPQIALLLPVQEAKERYAVEEGNIG